MRLYKVILIVVSLSFTNPLAAVSLDQSAVDEFVRHMVQTHHFEADELYKLFAQAKKSERVLNAISRPAEALPWYKYRQIFIRKERIDNGLAFWEKHRDLLQRAEAEYGVPAQIITAIIGVETSYGANKGSDRVLDALSTLAFHYPKRSTFFRAELEQFLLLAREQNVDPLVLTGSYAGAMGLPQFIPSSYRHYAVDFDGDGKIDIWNNPADAIGSVANYFSRHGWQPGGTVVIAGKAINDDYKKLLVSDLKPSVKANELYVNGILPVSDPGEDVTVKVISLETESGEEIWLGLENFYVITRYNHSQLYAMAVYQLSEEIRQRRNAGDIAKQ